MIFYLMKKLKNKVVTFRFSILSIFIILFTCSLLLLISVMYIRISKEMTYISVQLMKQIAANIRHQIIDDAIESAEVTSQSLAQLIQQDILSVEDRQVFLDYTYDLLNTKTLPIVQMIEWGDQQGNYLGQERDFSGGIFTNDIQHFSTESKQTIVYRNSQGEITKTVQTTTAYDPRIRPWYLEAQKEKKMAWSALFTFQYVSTHLLGMAVATPVYSDDGTLKGVVGVGVRLDYLAELLKHIYISKHGKMYIISTKEKKLIATSDIQHQEYLSLSSIDQLENPALADSLNHYLETKRSAFEIKVNHQHYLATFLPLSAHIPGDWVIAVVAPQDDFIGPLKITNFILMGMGLGILVFGIFIIVKFIEKILRPLHLIVSETKRIKLFQLEETHPIQSRIKEIIYMADAIHGMKNGLRSFQKYVPAGLVRQLIEKGEDAKIGGTKKELAILFTDIRNFTTLAEHMDPNQLMAHLCSYFDKLSNVIALNNGTIDKYMGDSIMAFWGAPNAQKSPNEIAARTALSCVRVSNSLNTTWAAQNKPLLMTRIGLHFGEAIVGNLGSSERLNYTAIGDSINMTSRLEATNKVYGTQIIVSESVYQLIKNKFVLRMLDRVILKGKSEPTYLYELIAERGESLPFNVPAYTSTFALGFAAYEQGNWNQAIQYFSECLKVYPEDTVAPIFIARCEQFKKTPPDYWKGTWQLVDK